MALNIPPTCVPYSNIIVIILMKSIAKMKIYHQINHLTIHHLQEAEDLFFIYIYIFGTFWDLLHPLQRAGMLVIIDVELGSTKLFELIEASQHGHPDRPFYTPPELGQVAFQCIKFLQISHKINLQIEVGLQVRKIIRLDKVHEATIEPVRDGALNELNFVLKEILGILHTCQA